MFGDVRIGPPHGRSRIRPLNPWLRRQLRIARMPRRRTDGCKVIPFRRKILYEQRSRERIAANNIEDTRELA